MTKRLLEAALVIIFTVFVLCGCWDYKDVNKSTLILAIGVDADDETILLSGEYAMMSGKGKQQGSDQSGSGGLNVVSFKASGQHFEDARRDLKGQITDPIFLGATSIVIFGTEYARQGIEPYINRVDKLHDYRKTTMVAISRETPSELFELGTDKSSGVGFLIEQNLNYMHREKRGLNVNVGKVLSYIDMDIQGYLLPYFGIVDGDIKYLGMAAMKDSKMVGVIDRVDCGGAIYLLMKNAVNNETLDLGVIDGEERKFNFEVKVGKCKRTFEYSDGQLKIDVKVTSKSHLDHQYNKVYIDDEGIKNLEKLLAEQIKSEIESVIAMSQNEFEADVFDFSKYFKAKNPKEFKALDWNEAYKTAQITVSVETEICCLNLTDTQANRRP